MCVCEIGRKAKSVIEMNKGDQILQSTVEENKQGSEGAGLIMNERAKII